MRQYNTLITALLIGKGNYHVGDSTIIMYLLDIWIRKENVNLRVILPQVIINFDCGPARSKNNYVTKNRRNYHRFKSLPGQNRSAKL